MFGLKLNKCGNLQPLGVVSRGSETDSGGWKFKLFIALSIYHISNIFLTFSLPYMTEISVVIRQWT